MKSAFSKLIAGLGVSFLLIALLTGCASTRYTEYDQKDRQALRTLAGGVSGALIAGNAGGAILGAFIVDMVHLATVRYDDVQLENGDEAARRYQDRYQAGKGKGDKKASRGVGDKKVEKIREEKKAEQATQEDKKAQRERDIEKRVEERMRELEAQSDEKAQKGRNLEKRAEEKEREKKAEEVKEVPKKAEKLKEEKKAEKPLELEKKAEQPLDRDKKAGLPGEEKKAEKPLELEKKAEQPLDQDKKAGLPGEEKKAEKPREEKKAAQGSEPGKKAERPGDEDRRVQLFIEGSSVLSQNVKVGALTEANVQYTVLVPSDEQDIVITETRMLWSVEKKIELARREVIRTPGTHRSTIKFRIPEDVPRGYYILYTTVAAGDRTRTAKSVMNITF